MAFAAPVWAAEPPEWRPEHERFERALERAVTELIAQVGASPVAEHVRWHYAIASGTGARRGKRLRPRLLLQVAAEEGASFEQAIDAALAVECLHNYSLVHDDLEDGDRLRHGRETVWARYGIAHGVNAGDAMCAVTYLTLLRNSAGLDPERMLGIVGVLHRVNLEMCAGQARDIAFEAAPAVAIDDYLAMIEGKTAALFGAGCELGALVAGADRDTVAAYAALGRTYGRAFQIHDDVTGTWSTLGQTGKICRSDIARRKWTYPIAWALAGRPSPARRVVAEAYARATPLEPNDVAAVVGALDALGARQAAAEACATYLREADRIAERHRIDLGGSVRTLCSAGVGAADRA